MVSLASQKNQASALSRKICLYAMHGRIACFYSVLLFPSLARIIILVGISSINYWVKARVAPKVAPKVWWAWE